MVYEPKAVLNEPVSLACAAPILPWCWGPKFCIVIAYMAITALSSLEDTRPAAGLPGYCCKFCISAWLNLKCCDWIPRAWYDTRSSLRLVALNLTWCSKLIRSRSIDASLL